MRGRLLVTARHLMRSRALVSLRVEVVDPGRRLSIGRKSSVSAFVRISTAAGAVRIGARTDVGAGCCIDGHAGGVAIGDDCLISPNVVIGGPGAPDQGDAGGSDAGAAGTRIGDNVWIGAGAVVLPGAAIADGVIVSPNSVVGGAVPANAIVQGNPGKVILTRR